MGRGEAKSIKYVPLGKWSYIINFVCGQPPLCYRTGKLHKALVQGTNTEQLGMSCPVNQTQRFECGIVHCIVMLKIVLCWWSSLTQRPWHAMTCWWISLAINIYHHAIGESTGPRRLRGGDVYRAGPGRWRLLPTHWPVVRNQYVIGQILSRRMPSCFWWVSELKGLQQSLNCHYKLS